jgi:hypothetical protein
LDPAVPATDAQADQVAEALLLTEASSTRMLAEAKAY